MAKENFYFEATDLYGGEANYCWVSHFRVCATSQTGAIRKISKYYGLKFRWDGIKYVSRSKLTGVFSMDDQLFSSFNSEDEFDKYYKFIEL